MLGTSDVQRDGIPVGRNRRNGLSALADFDYGGDESWPQGIPDVTLPVQFYEGARRAQSLCGERRLMLALLADAVSCLLAVNTRSGRLRQQARDWIAGRGASLVSFRDVCEALGLHPDATRAGIENLVHNPEGWRPWEWIRLDSIQGRMGQRMQRPVI